MTNVRLSTGSGVMATVTITGHDMANHIGGCDLENVKDSNGEPTPHLICVSHGEIAGYVQEAE